jgi:ssDNA-binding replication factor A large subunit
MSECIRDIYENSDLSISLNSFKETVEEKLDEYNGLVDTETAATLAVEDLKKREERTHDIEELHSDMRTVSVTVKVISKTEPHTFERDGGTEGTVTNLELADETDRIRGVFWDSKTEQINCFSRGDTLLIDNATVRNNDGNLELHSTDHTTVSPTEASLSISFETTEIEDVEIGETCCVTGSVGYVGEAETFEKDDGSEGIVQSVAIEDDTGRLRISLWGNHANQNVTTGDRMLLLDVTIREGLEDEPEGSAGWNTTILTKEADEETEGNTNNDGSKSTEQADPEKEDNNTETENESEFSDRTVEVTGMVIEDSDSVVLDTADGEITVETTESVTLGSTITVQGTETDGVLKASRVL